MGVIKNLYTSKPLILTIMALSAIGLFFNPLLALPKMLIFAMMTFTALVVGARLAKGGVKSAWGSLNASVNNSDESNTKQDKVDQAVNSMGNGKDLADPMIKALVDKLRDNGLTVTTNWDVAKQVIDALPEKYRHLSENRDNIRGFVYKGKVFINPEKTDLSVPIHEYTHIWAEALRQNNMNEWQNIVSLLKKESQLWEDTKKNYPYLETDDEIADEVLAQYSGSYGADKLKAFIVEGDKPKTVFKNLFKALEEFWKHIAKMFDCHFKKTDEIADRVLYDLVRGYNPQKNIDPHVATLYDNKPLSSKQENVGVATAMVESVNSKQKVVHTPEMEPKPGDKIRQRYFDPLPDWAFNDNMHIFELTRNGEHVGYGASYNVFGCKDLRIIDDATGKQFFDAFEAKDYDNMKKADYNVLNQYFLGEHTDYSQLLRVVAGMIEEAAANDQTQLYYDDYSKFDLLMEIAEHRGISKGQVYRDLSNEMIDIDHRFDHIMSFEKLLYGFSCYTYSPNSEYVIYNKEFKQYNIPQDVVKAYVRAINSPTELSDGEIFTKEEKSAIESYAKHREYDFDNLLDAVKQVYWYQRANICIPKERLEQVDSAMYLAAGIENPGMKVNISEEHEKLFLDEGLLVSKEEHLSRMGRAKNEYLFKIGYTGNRRPIYAVENKLYNGKYEYKVLSTDDLYELQDGSINMQHIRDMYWPEQRLNKVVEAVIERAKDSRARLFTDEQKAVVKEYFSKYSTDKDRDIAFFKAASRIRCNEETKDILGEWLDDAMKEFKDMASGLERESHQGKNLSY